jgi:hypothetical protein
MALRLLVDDLDTQNIELRDQVTQQQLMIDAVAEQLGQIATMISSSTP